MPYYGMPLSYPPQAPKPDEPYERPDTPETRRQVVTGRLRKALGQESDLAGRFADAAESSYGEMGEEARLARARLARLLGGQDSISAEQLRQGLQQAISGRQGIAAGARPADAAMARRAAAMQMSRDGSGMVGQQASAGIGERQAAQQSLANMILGARQQAAQAAYGGRGQAIDAARSGYASASGVPPEPTWWDKYGNAVTQGGAGLLSLAAVSDRRLKTDIVDGDKKARAALEGLRRFARSQHRREDR